jgi:DNA-binding MarR family transcriptional regulator
MPQATNQGTTAPAAPPTPGASRADGVADAVTGFIGALKRGIGDPEAGARTFLLGHVARLAPVRATDLAEHVHLDGSTISRHLRALEEAGLLERTPDPDDRRASLLALTDEGRVGLDRAMAARTAMFASATDEWDDHDVADLVRLLHRLSDDLENQ